MAQSPTVVAGRLNALAWDPYPALVWTSPLQRCAQAARLLASSLGAQLLIDERLIDADMGSWTGQLWEKIDQLPGGGPPGWIGEKTACHGGETALAVENRVRRWWNQLDGQTCHALVAHDLIAIALHVIARRQSWAESIAAPAYDGIEAFERLT